MPSYKATLCWDCRNAGRRTCSWSKDFQPVEGWNARKTSSNFGSYLVIECPEFIRDGIKGGQEKYSPYKNETKRTK